MANISRGISVDAISPTVLYIPPAKSTEETLWRTIAQFAWQARCNFEGPMGWTPEMVHPSCEPMPADASKSYGKCAPSNVTIAQEIGQRVGIELAIGAGDSLMPTRSRLRSVADHVIAQEPSKLPGRTDPDAMILDVAGDQIGLADVVVASRLAIFSLFGVIYHHAYRGEFGISDFMSRGELSGLPRHVAALQICLNTIDISNSVQAAIFERNIRQYTAVRNDTWGQMARFHQPLFVE